MDSKFETRGPIFLSSCQIQIFESLELLARELGERMVSVLTHTVSEPEFFSNKKPDKCVRMSHLEFGSLPYLREKR